MAELLKFELVSPERLVKSSEVKSVTIPGTEGDFTVLIDHAPVLSTIRPGVIEVTDENQELSRIFVRGGFAEVSASGLTVLAEQAIFMEDLDAEKIGQEVTNAQEDVNDAKTDIARQRAQEKLDHLRQLQSAL